MRVKPEAPSRTVCMACSNCGFFQVRQMPATFFSLHHLVCNFQNIFAPNIGMLGCGGLCTLHTMLISLLPFHTDEHQASPINAFISLMHEVLRPRKFLKRIKGPFKTSELSIDVSCKYKDNRKARGSEDKAKLLNYQGLSP